MFVQFLYLMFVDQSGFYCSSCPSCRIYSLGMKWIFVAQISWTRGQWLQAQTLGVLRSDIIILSWQYLKLIFSSRPAEGWISVLGVIRLNNARRESLNLSITKQIHLSSYFHCYCEVCYLSFDWSNNLHPWCLALACRWLGISNDPIGSQYSVPSLPSSHHYISCMLPHLSSKLALIAPWWVEEW